MAMDRTSRNETGQDVELSVNGTRIIKTTTTYNIVKNTAESVYDDTQAPSTATTSRYMEGSFEWEGSQSDAVTLLHNADGSEVDDIRMLISESNYGWRCEEISLQGLDNEAPSDGKSSHTQNWKADIFRRV